MPFTLLVCFAAFAASASGGSDPLLGTWTLDPEQSQIERGLRVVIERHGEAFHYSSGGMEFTALFDGDDYPLKGISVPATVRMKRIDARTIERTYRRDGNALSSATLAVSADGRFLTVRITRLGSPDKPEQWVNTYKKSGGGNGDDPFAGVWDRNPVRSMGNSNSEISFAAFDGDGYRFSGEQVEYAAKADGREYRVTGSIVADTVVLKRLDRSTLEETWKTGGQVAATVVRVVTPEGRLQATVSGRTPQGDRFENVFVYRHK